MGWSLFLNSIKLIIVLKLPLSQRLPTPHKIIPGDLKRCYFFQSSVPKSHFQSLVCSTRSNIMFSTNNSYDSEEENGPPKAKKFRQSNFALGNFFMPFQCAICQKTFAETADLQWHFDSKHTLKSGKKVKTEDRCHLRQSCHNAKINGEYFCHYHVQARQFKCSKCNWRFMLRKQLEKHELIKHEGKTKMPECLECGQVFDRYKMLLKHVKKNCPNSKVSNSKRKEAEKNEDAEIDIEKSEKEQKKETMQSLLEWKNSFNFDDGSDFPSFHIKTEPVDDYETFAKSFSTFEPMHSGHRGYKAKKFFGLNCISIMSVVPHNVKKLPRKVLSM